MNRLQPVRFSVAAMSLALVALAVGVFYFLAGMSQSTYLVTDGARIGMRYLDKPHYDMHLQGLIFTLSFLIAGALLLLMVLLPDRDRRPTAGEEAPPQPRRQPGQPQGAQAAVESAPQPAAQRAPQPASAQSAQTSPLSIEGGEIEPPPVQPASEAEPAHGTAQPQAAQPQAAPAQAARPSVSVEEEVLRSAATADDLPAVDFDEHRYEDTGEEDVVYGAGRVTEDAVWEFVQQYPDSAVKFLYRKTLDNKPLSPTEEDIYRNWEVRGMTRAKVREIVLEIMRWQSLPDSFPHEIWRALRDQIFEFRAAGR